MDKKELITGIRQTFSELKNTLSDFSNEELNRVPFEGSWTAGQITRHIIKSDSGFVKLLNGNVMDTARNPYEMVDMIRKEFLDMNVKSKSPDFVEPEIRVYDKNELLKELELLGESIIISIEKIDLEKTCTDFELPVIGYLTGIEAVAFTLYHTQRHLQQLKNISKAEILSKESQ